MVALPLADAARKLASPFYPTYAFNPSILSFPSSLPTSFSLSALQSWYANADPLHPALLFASGITVIVYVLGEITGNLSQVDRIWTILPLLYSAHFTFFPKWSGRGEVDTRQLLLFWLQVLWCIRLTTNTIRRGFFDLTSEDYRWEYVRSKTPKWQVKLMNLFFVAIAQNALLLAAELPQYLLLTHSLSSTHLAKPLTQYDYLLSVIFVLILVVEMIADNQQQKFQNFKIKNGGKVPRGFVTDGLWSWSRHPNFACEQSTWYILYLFTVLPFLPASFHPYPSYKSIEPLLQYFSLSHILYLSRTISLAGILENISVSSIKVAWHSFYSYVRGIEGTYWNYSVWSPLTMSMLFYASTDLTEEISAGKYPLYKQYQKRVGMFWPPITILKTIWLTLTLQKGKLDREVFGSGDKKKTL